MSRDTDGPSHACHCLNIRITCRPQAQNGMPPPTTNEGFSPIYVGDDGIDIKHNELTLRYRSSIQAIKNTDEPRHIQYTTVSCLVCGDSVYRVKAEVQPDMDAKEGPILPTEDWVERDTLLSKSGWVEVPSGQERSTIGQDEVKQLLSSPAYSSTFSLAVPKKEHVLSTEPSNILPYTKLSLPEAITFLPSLPPFILPPPFTPSHPIFRHLSSVASDVSSAARVAAEKRIHDYAQSQLNLLEEEEARLKSQLEEIWKYVKEGLKKVERERDADLRTRLQGRRQSLVSGIVSPGGLTTSSSVRTFVPSTYHPPRPSVTPNTRQSALSASLATSSFHHPREQQENGARIDAPRNQPSLTPSPPPYASNPSTPNSSPENEGLTRSYKRNMDPQNDTAVTFRYYTIEEQEAARRKNRGAEQEVNKKVSGDNKDTSIQKPTSNATVRSTTEHKKTTSSTKLEDGPKKKDGQRKVTFDTEPAVVTIKRDIKSEKEEEIDHEKGEDLLFDIDDIGEDTRYPLEEETNAQQTLSNEETDVAKKPENARKDSFQLRNAVEPGLPQSFAALRPSSLPAPSNIRPPLRLQGHRDGKPSHTRSIAQNRDMMNKSRGFPEESVQSKDILTNQKHLLDLVAAHTPSHRGAWDTSSFAWKLLNRSGKRAASDDESDSSLDDTNTQVGRIEEWREYRIPDFVGSLPVSMAPAAQQKGNAALSLYPKSPLIDPQASSLPAIAEENNVKSAVSNRKAAYAERNLAREMDPGVLDFAEDADDDDEEDNTKLSEDADDNQDGTSKSRQYALNIIKARNSVPPEGLWRSLA